MEFERDVHQEFEVEITFNQFKDFLVAKQRSSKCPVCPHKGAWNFYVDKTHGLDGESLMALTPMKSMYHSAADDTYYVIAMDCPNCGYVSYTASSIVIDWLDEQAPEQEA